VRLHFEISVPVCHFEGKNRKIYIQVPESSVSGEKRESAGYLFVRKKKEKT